jgi:3'-phosphoadenosine 5'-phosphosulfate sulfotransferase (PAPS reductase)/FAD synthetase
MLTLLPGQIPDRPSHIVVSHSGGKDSTLMLALMVEQFGGQVPITVHHQVLPEAWEGTVEYTQQTCDRYGVPLIVEQAHYHGYECPLCGNRWLSAAPKVKCTIRRTAAGSRGCGAEMGIVVAHIRGLVDLMNWRKMWPSPTIRWCTSYLKRDLYNKWIRRNRAVLGDRPITCMGERWRESTGRANLPYFARRSKHEWMTDYHPLLHLKRIEVFRGLLERGIEPHWSYKAQGLTDHDMYEVDVEGGPRCSCVCCIYLTPENIGANLVMDVNQELSEQLIDSEERNQYFFREGLSIKTLVNRTRTPKVTITMIQRAAS